MASKKKVSTQQASMFGSTTSAAKRSTSRKVSASGKVAVRSYERRFPKRKKGSR